MQNGALLRLSSLDGEYKLAEKKKRSLWRLCLETYEARGGKIFLHKLPSQRLHYFICS